jgi:hypothetical protein
MIAPILNGTTGKFKRGNRPFYRCFCGIRAAFEMSGCAAVLRGNAGGPFGSIRYAGKEQEEAPCRAVPPKLVLHRLAR